MAINAQLGDPVTRSHGVFAWMAIVATGALISPIMLLSLNGLAIGTGGIGVEFFVFSVIAYILGFAFGPVATAFATIMLGDGVLTAVGVATGYYYCCPRSASEGAVVLIFVGSSFTGSLLVTYLLVRRRRANALHFFGIALLAAAVWLFATVAPENYCAQMTCAPVV